MVRNYLQGLTNVSQNEEDLEFLEQANGLLASLRSVLESKIKNGNLPRSKPWLVPFIVAFTINSLLQYLEAP